MADRNSGSDKIHADHKPKHVDASETLLNGVIGLGWQALLIGEGMAAGGITEAGKKLEEVKAGKVETIKDLGLQAGLSAGTGVLAGCILGSKREMLKLAMGGIGTVAGLLYGKITWDKYSSNKELGQALDAVYKHGDWNTFNKQKKVAERELGKQGFEVGFTGLTGAAGMGGAMIFGKGIMRKTLPAAAEYLYGKPGDKLSKAGKITSLSKGAETSFKSDLSSFVNEINHGGIHVSRSNETCKPYLFDKDNRISNIFIKKGTTVDEIENQIVVGSLANKISSNDKSALEVALKGAEKASYGAAEFGDMELALAEGKAFSESQVGQVRKLQGAQKYAIEGSHAYFRRQPGNDYTNHLKNVYGEWSAKRRVEAKSSVVNIPISDSADACAHRIASENLAQLGIRPSDCNLAAAKNDFIQKMANGDKHKAVRAISYYLEGHPENTNLAANVRIARLGELAKNLSTDQVKLITNRANDFEAGNFPYELFSKPMMSAVDSLVSRGIVLDATKAHRMLSKLAAQPSRQSSIDDARELIKCANTVGINGEQLMRNELVTTGNSLLKQLAANDQKDMIMSLAVSLKHFGSTAKYKDVTTVNALLRRGYKVEQISSELIRK